MPRRTPEQSHVPQESHELRQQHLIRRVPFRVNLIGSPFPKLNTGTGLIFGHREFDSGANGELRRLHTDCHDSF